MYIYISNCLNVTLAFYDVNDVCRLAVIISCVNVCIHYLSSYPV